MEMDPLLENLDELLPLDTSSATSVPANLPSAIEDLCAALAREPGVESVDIGRQVCSAVTTKSDSANVRFRLCMLES